MEKEVVIQRMHRVLSAYPSLRIAYLYGSFLSRENFRDIDIALLADREYPQDSFLKYAAEAGDRLEDARYRMLVKQYNRQMRS